VQRATGPRLLRDRPRPAGPEPLTSRSLVEHANNKSIPSELIFPLTNHFNSYHFAICIIINKVSSCHCPPNNCLAASSNCGWLRHNLHAWALHIHTFRLTCHDMGSHSVTCHPTQVNTPRLTPAIEAGNRFTYPRGMEG